MTGLFCGLRSLIKDLVCVYHSKPFLIRPARHYVGRSAREEIPNAIPDRKKEGICFKRACPQECIPVEYLPAKQEEHTISKVWLLGHVSHRIGKLECSPKPRNPVGAGVRYARADEIFHLEGEHDIDLCISIQHGLNEKEI